MAPQNTHLLNRGILFYYVNYNQFELEFPSLLVFHIELLTLLYTFYRP